MHGEETPVEPSVSFYARERAESPGGQWLETEGHSAGKEGAAHKGGITVICRESPLGHQLRIK